MLDLGTSDKLTQGLYIDLDSIFDMRFAVLEEVSPHLAVENLLNGWNKRQEDAPLGIEKEVYQELYSRRDVATLRHATMTECLDLARHWMADALKQAVASPHPITLRLYVNVFPYQLTKEEASELGEQIRNFFTQDIQLTMVNADPRRLTPETAKRYFSGMFMYDYHLWLEHHAKEGNFQHVKIPDVALYTPRLFHGHKPDADQERELAEKKIDVFKEWEAHSSPIIGLEFVPIEMFSTLLHPGFFKANWERVAPFLDKGGKMKDHYELQVKGL